MQLAKHVAQGKLIYLSHSDDDISISENQHYRWLAFTYENSEQVIQSVMHKRKPWLLTLPHQTAMMLPLLFFKPKNIVELGLGGGNFQRFIQHTSENIEIHSVEHSSLVIDCFNQYFNPEHNKAQLIYSDSKQWLKHNHTDFDWYIFDVYQKEIQSYNNTVNQLENITSNIKPNTCLSINLPDATDNEVNLLLTIIKDISPQHDITYFHIPNYLNIVIHIMPKHWQPFNRLKRKDHSYLPNILFSRWKKFWQHGKKLPE